MRTKGLTLVEVLITLAILAVLLALAGNSLAKHRERLAVRDAAQTVTSTFGQAKYLTRRHNVPTTVSIDPTARTITLQRSGTVVATRALNVDSVTVSCRAVTCPTEFNFSAPFAALGEDVKVTLARNATVLNAYLLGPNGIEVIRP